MLQCHCRQLKSMLAVNGHIHVSRDTSLSSSHSVTRSFERTLLRCVTVTRLRAQSTLPNERQTDVRRPTVTGGIDCSTIHEQLFAPRRQVVDGDETGSFDGIRGQILATNSMHCEQSHTQLDQKSSNSESVMLSITLIAEWSFLQRRKNAADAAQKYHSTRP